jgi:hypothetical protein
MHIPSLMLSIAALGLAGAATAAPAASTLAQRPSAQCRSSWTLANAETRQCAVTPVSTRSSVEPYDLPAHHVMTRQEIRAELDGIKLDRVDSRQPPQPAPTLISERN